MNKIDWLSLYKDEVRIEMGNREREVAKLEAEINVYRQVKDELEKIIDRIKKEDASQNSA